MTYDWEKIFKSKTNKELFDIVSGKVSLSFDAVDFAIAELKRRGVDTNDIEFNNKIWRLTDLISENDDETIFRKDSIHISLKSYIIIIVGIILFLLSIDKFSDITISIGTILFLIAIITIIVLIENVSYNIRKRNQIKHIEKIKKIQSELLEKTETLKKKKEVLDELKRQKDRTDKDISYLVVIFLLLDIIAGLAIMFSFVHMK